MHRGLALEGLRTINLLLDEHTGCNPSGSAQVKYCDTWLQLHFAACFSQFFKQSDLRRLNFQLLFRKCVPAPPPNQT